MIDRELYQFLELLYSCKRLDEIVHFYMRYKSLKQCMETCGIISKEAKVELETLLCFFEDKMEVILENSNCA